MTRTASALAILALIGSSTAQAAQDMGLTLHNGPRASAPRGGVGAQASVTIRLGDRRTVRESEKVMLGIAAGPMLAIPSRNSAAGERRAIAGLASFTLKPGYSSTVSVASQPVLRSYTLLGAAEADQQEGGETKPKKKQRTGDKIAWVAAVAGGVMVLLIGAFAIACSGGNCSD